MARIVAIVNQKGGVGKTTFTMAAAGALRDADLRPLVVDTDPQRSASEWCERLPEDQALAWAAERDPDVLRQLGRARQHDLLLCDTPGSLESEDALSAVVSVSDFVIVICKPDKLSITPTVRTMQRVIRPTGTPAKVLLNLVQPQGGAQRVATFQQAYADAGVPVFRSWVRQLSAHQHAADQGRLITSMPGARAQGAADDTRRVVLELIANITGLKTPEPIKEAAS